MGIWLAACQDAGDNLFILNKKKRRKIVIVISPKLKMIAVMCLNLVMTCLNEKIKQHLIIFIVKFYLYFVYLDCDTIYFSFISLSL